VGKVGKYTYVNLKLGEKLKNPYIFLMKIQNMLGAKLTKLGAKLTKKIVEIFFPALDKKKFQISDQVQGKIGGMKSEKKNSPPHDI